MPSFKHYHQFLYKNQSHVDAQTIFSCIKKGELVPLIALVNSNYSLHIVTSKGFDPVCYAIKHNQLAILMWLVDEQHCSLLTAVSKINKKEHPFINNSPMDLAWYLDHFEIIKWLTSKVKHQRDEGELQEMLDYAIDIGETDFVKWLVDEQGVALNNSNDQSFSVSRNALVLAVKSGNLSLVKWLIEDKDMFVHSPYSDIRTMDKSYFLANVMYYGQLEIIKWLFLEKNYAFDKREMARYKWEMVTHIPTLVCGGHIQVLMWAEEQNYLNVNDFCGQSKEEWVATAISASQLTMAKWLVDEKKCALSYKNKDGDNAVLSACKAGSLAIVKWLIDEKNLSLAVQDNQHHTPVILALASGQLELLKYLVVDKNCTLEVKSLQGSYPIHYTIFNSDLVLLKWLVDEQGCSLYRNRNDITGQNILVLAFNIMIDKPWFDYNKAIIRWLCLDKNIFVDKQFRKEMFDYSQTLTAHDFKWATYFWSAITNCCDEQELQQWLTLFDDKNKDIRKNGPDDTDYAVNIERAIVNGNIGIDSIIEHYCSINQHSIDHLIFLIKIRPRICLHSKIKQLLVPENHHNSDAIMKALTTNRPIFEIILNNDSLKGLLQDFLQAVSSTTFFKLILNYFHQCQHRNEAHYLIALLQHKIEKTLPYRQGHLLDISHYRKVISKLIKLKVDFTDVFIDHMTKLITNYFEQFHLDDAIFYLTIDRIDEALNILDDAINNDATYYTDKIQAYITYAELLLLWVEDMTVIPKLFLSQDAFIKRALYAYYLLCQIDNFDKKSRIPIVIQQVSRLKARLHMILSGNTDVHYIDASEETWLPEVKREFDGLKSETITTLSKKICSNAITYGSLFYHASKNDTVSLDRDNGFSSRFNSTILN